MRFAPGRTQVAAALAAWLSVSTTFAAEPPIAALAFSPDGKHVIAASQSGTVVYAWPDLKIARRLETQSPNLLAAAFSPDGRRVVLAGGTPGEFGTVTVYNWPSGEVAWRESPGDDTLRAVVWNGDGTRLAAAGMDGAVRLLNSADGSQIHILKGHSKAVLALAFLPDGKTLVSAGLDQSLRVWDARAGSLVRTLSNHTAPVLGLAVRFQADEESLPVVASIGEDRTIRLWQPTIGRMMRFARLDRAVPQAVAWRPDGTRLFVVTDTGSLVTLDPDTAQVLDDRPVVDGWLYSLAASPQKDALLLGGAAGRLVRWELPEQ